ncbi:unnamed protein product [Urochloa humidicola]
MENMSSRMDRVLAFLKRKFPGEDCINEMVAPENDVVERVCENDIQRDSNYSDDYHSDNNLEESSANAQPPKTTVQNNTKATKTNDEGYANSSLRHESMIARRVHIENRGQGNKDYAGLALPRDYQTKSQQGSQNKKVANQSHRVYDQKQLYSEVLTLQN